jgi:hypothetical protein
VGRTHGRTFLVTSLAQILLVRGEELAEYTDKRDFI